MPSVTKKPAVKAPTESLPYPDLEVNGVKIPVDKLRITASKMKQLLGWETRSEIVARLKKENPGLDVDNVEIEAEPMLQDMNGEDVWCWSNLTNRPFRKSHALELAQDILNRCWAGPTIMPGETVNGETIIISRKGHCHSIQHRGAALILATQMWHKNKAHWKGKWDEEPYIESLIVTGVSDNPAVVQTLDNVLARTESDVFFTTGEFPHLKDQLQRAEAARILANAVDLLWKRVRAEEQEDQHFQTHSISKDFLNRHPKLRECVMLFLDINSKANKRPISQLRLMIGHCAAMLYLMGSSETDIDAYLAAKPRPSEKVLDWTWWDKAKEFWKQLALQKSDLRKAVANALGQLVDENSLTGGRSVEQRAVLALAWKVFREGVTPTKADLKLEYHENAHNQKVFTDRPTFGGIDHGDKKRKELEDNPSEEDLKDRTEQEFKSKEEKRKHDVDKLMQLRQQSAAAKAPASVPAKGSGLPAKPAVPLKAKGK